MSTDSPLLGSDADEAPMKPVVGDQRAQTTRCDLVLFYMLTHRTLMLMLSIRHHYPILLVSKPRLRETKQLAYGHTALNRRGWDLN